MARSHTWESLRELTTRRQFPRVSGTDQAAVVSLVGAVGPIQSQAPRAPFLTVSSRLPGATNATLVAAYDSTQLVRSTSLRGTVHTSVREQHGWLDSVSRRASANLWRRTFSLSAADLDRLRARIEELTADGWVTHADLHERVAGWLAREGFDQAVAASREGVGFALFRGHSALLRRPLTGGWHQQGRYGYRTAAIVLGDPQVDADEATARLVRQHLAAFGPATRHDVAWWSGDGLRRVDAVVQSLGDEVVSVPGPDGLDYLDLAEPPVDGLGDPGLRLVPEYDGLLLGYAPAGRSRFADSRVMTLAWNRANGVHSPTVLVDGKLRGTWRLSAAGRASRVEVTMLAGERLPTEDEVGGQAEAVSAVLAVGIDAVEVRAAEA